MYDVAIAGFGPTGACLAGLLAEQGHRVCVVDRETEVYSLPRAVHFDHEVMRIFQTLGVAERLLPHTRPASGCEFWTADRDVLISVPMGEETSQGWKGDYMFHQPSLEAVLRERASELPSTDVHLGCEVTGVRQDDDGAALRMRDARGCERDVEARWIVGCDGAGSLVRAEAGLPLEDLGFDEPWVVVDLRGAYDLPDICVQLCDPARPTTLVPCAHGFYRFEFMLRPDEDPREMVQPARLRALLASWVDPDAVEVVRAAVYRFHALYAREWTRGRIAIAGDAAHQTPPFLGQGMCAGIRDAMNLAWKLDRVLREQASPALVSTYGGERLPHVREMIERAVNAGRIICTQNPELARARDAQMLASPGGRESLLPGLPAAGEGCFQSGEHRLVRRLSPQPQVRDGRRARLQDEVTGSGFRLVMRSPEGWPDERTRRAFAAVGGRLAVWSDAPGPAPADGVWLQSWEPGAARSFFEANDIHAFVARPDHLVFGVAPRPADTPALLADLEKQLARA